MSANDIRQGLRGLVDLLDKVSDGENPAEFVCWALTQTYVTIKDEDAGRARATLQWLLDGLSDVTLTVTPGVGPYEFRAEGTLNGLGVVVLADAAVVCEQVGMVPVEVMQPRYTFDGAQIPVAR